MIFYNKNVLLMILTKKNLIQLNLKFFYPKKSCHYISNYGDCYSQLHLNRDLTKDILTGNVAWFYGHCKPVSPVSNVSL